MQLSPILKARLEMNETTDSNTVESSTLPCDDAFDYEGYQIVHGEFFSHISEPCITFNKCKVSVNSVCVQSLPDVDYVQILVNPEAKKVAIKPCSGMEKDSLRWCRNSKGKKVPRQIICRVFYAKIMSLMKWNPSFRYRIMGKLIQSNIQNIFVFDLNTPEVFFKGTEYGTTSSSHTAHYLENWQNQFGIPATEHMNETQISIFEGYTVFNIETEQKQFAASVPEAPPDLQAEISAQSVDNNAELSSTTQETKTVKEITPIGI